MIRNRRAELVRRQEQQKRLAILHDRSKREEATLGHGSFVLGRNRRKYCPPNGRSRERAVNAAAER